MSVVSRKTTTYAVKCDADWEAGPRGCSGYGRSFGSKEEACGWAREMGWAADPPSICPAHVETFIADRTK